MGKYQVVNRENWKWKRKILRHCINNPVYKSETDCKS